MKYAILDWMDGSMAFFETKPLAVHEFNRQLKEHKETVMHRNKFDEFDKMVIEIINQYNSVDE